MMVGTVLHCYHRREIRVPVESGMDLFIGWWYLCIDTGRSVLDVADVLILSQVSFLLVFSKPNVLQDHEFIS